MRANAENEGHAFVSEQGAEFRDECGVVFAVGIHRDCKSETPREGFLEGAVQCAVIAEIGLVANDDGTCACGFCTGFVRRGVVHHDHFRIFARRLHDAANCRRLAESRNEDG
nr:hypothetical protein [Parvibaculum sp.]